MTTPLSRISESYAKSRINQTKSLLELTFDGGLSSPERLHDLVINLSAMSPGEYKQGGAGLKIYYGVHDTPFGKSLIATTARGVCNLHFLDLADEDIIFNSIFDSTDSKQQKSLTLLVKGTNFQIQVWRALLNIPKGGLVTYQTVAEMIGRPTASRAVGNAVGKNPISYLIPCHRVIKSSGEIGNYRWGEERKNALLGWEASQIRDN